MRNLIGTPAFLDREIAILELAHDEALPPACTGALFNVVTLFALAADAFGDREQALQWWRTPLRLDDEGVARPPPEWLDDCGAGETLAAHLRQHLVDPSSSC